MILRVCPAGIALRQATHGSSGGAPGFAAKLLFAEICFIKVSVPFFGNREWIRTTSKWCPGRPQDELQILWESLIFLWFSNDSARVPCRDCFAASHSRILGRRPRICCKATFCKKPLFYKGFCIVFGNHDRSQPGPRMRPLVHCRNV